MKYRDGTNKITNPVTRITRTGSSEFLNFEIDTTFFESKMLSHLKLGQLYAKSSWTGGFGKKNTWVKTFPDMYYVVPSLKCIGTLTTGYGTWN